MSNNNDYYSSQHMTCPICNYPMSTFEKSGIFSGGTHFICKKCGLGIVDKNYNKFYIENAPENTKINKKYKFKTLYWADLIQIGQGNYTREEEIEKLQLMRREITDEMCPACYEKYLERFNKDGMLSFDSLICPNCNIRFEIHEDKVSFIYSRNNFSILWEFYNQKLYLNQIRNILSQNNQEIHLKRMEYEKNNPEDFFTEDYSQMEEPENIEYNFIKIDINNASVNDLLKIQKLNDNQIMQLIRLKESDIIIESYSELQNILDLSDDEIEYAKNELIINMPEEEPTDNYDTYNQNISEGNEEQTDEDETNIYKIDLNTATVDELTDLPSINLIKAKKIINLRNENNYIKSYDDLKEKLNLKPEQITQIRKRTIISEVNNDISGRIIDF